MKLNHSKLTDYKNKTAGCQWFTPVILATQEAKIRKIEASLGK
jgi:hypothetical protein